MLLKLFSSGLFCRSPMLFIPADILAVPLTSSVLKVELKTLTQVPPLVSLYHSTVTPVLARLLALKMSKARLKRLLKRTALDHYRTARKKIILITMLIIYCGYYYYCLIHGRIHWIRKTVQNLPHTKLVWACKRKCLSVAFIGVNTAGNLVALNH